MKINKWTMGLAAVGLVSLASVAKAEETLTPLMTAVSSTIISGYVDVSAVWNPGTGNAVVPPFSFNSGKQDGFNLNVVNLTLEKPLDEGQWSAGYKVELLFGPDAVGYNTSANAVTTSSGIATDPGFKPPPEAGGGGTGAPPAVVTASGSTLSDFGIKQAYVALRAPVGNGLDFKLGVFDSPLGYESFASHRNPNYTRSYGYTIEPTQLTGVIASYQFCDAVSASAGIANVLNAGINARSPRAESHKAYMGSITLTAPESMGVLAGSALYAGIIDGFGSPTADQTSIYVGATVATPIAGLKLGAAYDEAHDFAPIVGFPGSDYVNTMALYASFQATEKLSLHARGEYAKGIGFKAEALTGTIQYDLWQNVISRLEVRWDHVSSAPPGLSRPLGGTSSSPGGKKNAVMVAANFIYVF